MITDVSPRIDCGRHPVKRVEGEPVVVDATAFADGHDALWLVVRHRPPGARRWIDVPMASVNPGLDRWQATFVPIDQGPHPFRVVGWIDQFASWAHATMRKVEAGQHIDSELLAGAALLDVDAEGAPKAEAALLREAAARLRAGELSDLTDPGGSERPSAATLHRRRLRRADASMSSTIEVLVEREKALFSTWYELFPRSTFVAGPPAPGRAPIAPGDDEPVHGTLAGVVDELDRVAAMGFDVLYLPPIHPIGTSFRKGPDNAEVAGPGDVGSPWAIGSAAGGHTAVHPELGTLDDMRALVGAAEQRGIEVALDLAFQCSPDHPWVTEHPEWFAHRPDGSIQYAENPPKRYQDIYPLDFSGPAWRDLWEALLGVAEFWMDQGVRVFRVDNPHTKPFAFWEWFIAQLRRRDPGVILLSEAFTRPEVMAELTALRIHPELQLLHVAGLQGRADRLRPRGGRRARRRRLPGQLLAEHARHPPVAPPRRPSRDVRPAPPPGGHAQRQLRGLRTGLRARGEHLGGQRQGGVRRLGEVRAPALAPRPTRKPP